MSQLPVVAVVGRPNVGKSTLVNRILGRREAIVQHVPGVTRDRVLYRAEWAGRPFMLVDTGGLEADPVGELAAKVAETAAAAEADVVVLVVDATTGMNAEDMSVVDVVRRLGRPVVLAVNKADNPERDALAADFWSLGLGDPHPVSALHGRGVGDLLDRVTAGFAETEPQEHPEPSIAIVGRPNVGKSSLFNRLVGAELSLVHDEPGTTRDTVDTVAEVDGERYRFIDTAGMRRTSRIDDSVEYFSLVRALRALDRCDLAILVIDDAQGIARQDLRIAEEIIEQGRSAVIVLSKVDLMEPSMRRIEREEVRRRLPYLSWAPLIETSTVTGEGVGQIMPAVRRILEARSTRIPTPVLNAVIEDLQARTPIPSKRPGARVKFAVQAEVSPPTIVLFGMSRIPPQWIRYLDRNLRKRFGFEGTPIRVSTRGGQRRQTGRRT